MFCHRTNCSDSAFFYEAIQLNVTVNGYYTFVCNSSMDTYGYLYNNTFNPAYPAMNVLTKNDNAGGNLQFMLSRSLQTLSRYILVVTTYYKNITGPFTITAMGSASVGFSRINVTSKS
ncbi:unnamed protein product [Rotaria sp. Silwood1]|nr:unnamed protein product [Rotaria sp. Silwood1]